MKRKHETSLYIEHGKSIEKHSQDTYNQILAAKPLWRFCDIESLFVPKCTHITCKSDDLALYKTKTDILFEIKPGDNNNLGNIKSGYKIINFKKDHPYLLKANPKSIGADSGSVMLDENHTHLTYGPNTSLPVVVIYDNAGISVTHKTGKVLHADVIVDGMPRTVKF